MLTETTLEHYRRKPAAFIEDALIDPISGKPFRLLPAERQFLVHAFKLNETGRLRYPELVYAAPKKSGKSTFAALFVIVCIVLFGGRHAEGYVIANDYEQASSRVFEMTRRIIEASPSLRRECKITGSQIIFEPTKSTIIPLAADYAGAAGGAPTISSFDEGWGYLSERSRRLFDEMIPIPTRKNLGSFDDDLRGLRG